MTRLAIRWALLPFEVVIGFVLVVIAVALIAGWFVVWWEPVGGFLGAIAVVCISYARAPRQPLLVAVISFVLGGVAAYQLLWYSSVPEGYSAAYQPTSIPFGVTLAGGGLALAAVAIHAALDSRSTSNISLERARR
jgi:hypothetical protein